MSNRLTVEPDLLQLVEESATLSPELKQRFREVIEPSAEVKSDPSLLDEALNRASLRGYFNLSEVLEAVAEQSRSQVAAELARFCVADYDGPTRKWILDTDVRRERLKVLASEPAKLWQYASKVPDSDALGWQLKEFLQGDVPALDTLDQDRLGNVLLAAQWAHDIADSRIEPRQVRRQIAHRQLLEPFQTLLQHGFFGRDKALKELRMYVGVLPSQSLLEQGERLLHNVVQFGPAKPLSICGPGGAGKSTLLAKFLHDHATAALTHRFPFAYLDFDRSPLVASEPLSLLLEVTRQLAHQFPEQSDALTELMDTLRNNRRDEQRVTDSKSVDHAGSYRLDDASFLYGCVRALCALLRPLTASDKPFVLVLDTFEEVLQRGEADVRGVRRLVEALRENLNWQALRIVIAGRASVRRELSTGTELVIDRLESHDAALQMLRSRAPKLSRSDANRIVSHVGRVPLSLKLAGDLANRESAAAVLELDTGSVLDRFLDRLDSERISALLYRRTLTHIDDEEVRKLAYPGLVLRKVTPELLETVLAPALQLQLSDASAVRDLFDRFAKYVSLVTRSGDTLYHRTDVRQLTLHLMRKDASEKRREAWNAINRGAIAHYESSDAVADQAEAFYHRLMLDDGNAWELDQRWNPKFDEFLKPIINDLPTAGAIFLKAKLALHLRHDEISSLPFDLWADYVSGRATRALQLGAPDQVVDLIRERSEWASQDKRVCHALAVALKLTGDFQPAQSYLSLVSELPLKSKTAGPQLELTNLLEQGDLFLKLGLNAANNAFQMALGHAQELRDRSATCVAAAGVALCLQQQRLLRAESSNAWSLLAETAHHAAFESRAKPRLSADIVRNVVLALPVDVSKWLAESLKTIPLSSINAKEYEILAEIAATTSAGPMLLSALDIAMREMEMAGEGARLRRMSSHLLLKIRNVLRQVLKEATDRELLLFKRLLLVRQLEWRLPLYYSVVECLEDGARRELSDDLKDLAFSVQTRDDTDNSRRLSTTVATLDAHGLLPRAHELFARAAIHGCRNSVLAQRAHVYVDAYQRWHDLMTLLATQEGRTK